MKLYLSSAGVPARSPTVFALAIALSYAAGCSSGGGGASTGAPGAPGTGSGAITGVTFDWASHRHAAPGSDNWPITWADDDHQYAVWGDGGGFGGSDRDGRASFGIARIAGGHDAYQGINRFGGKGGHCRSNIDGKGHGAPVSIGGVLYVWITPGSDQNGYREFVLHRSTDKGCTWSRRSVRFDRSTYGVSYGSFVQFGRDNASAPGGHAYVIATEIRDTSSLHVVQRPGRVMLFRVPSGSIENQSAYEYFAGSDVAGQPSWSHNHRDKVAIYEDLDGVGSFPQITFVPGLNRYVYANQHGDGESTASTRSLLTMADAPQPWGPWTVFHRGIFFPQIEQSVFQWNFAPKWFRNGGREFTIVFSGINSNDSWNTVNGAFAVAP